MKNKKIIILCICVVFVITIVVFFKDKVLDKLEEQKYERMWVEFLNYEKPMPHIKDASFWFLNIVHGRVNTEIAIDSAIENYVMTVEYAIKRKMRNNSKKYNELVEGGTWEKAFVYGLKSYHEDKIEELITDSDIEKYNSGELYEEIVNCLEQKLIHKSDEKYKGWYIKNDKNKRIELPYNVYFDYTFSEKKILNEVEKILKVDFCDETIEYSYNNKEYSTKSFRCKVIYLCKDGVRKEKIFPVYYENNEHNKYEISPACFNDLYIEQKQSSSITFGQHDYDREKEEKEKAWAEVLKRRSEYKDVRYEDRIELPQFEKYEANAHLLLHKFDDGSTALKFFATKFIIKDGKNDIECREYYLPYENLKSTKEALEMYLADKEHYDADEAFLRENNRLYNGD